MPFLVPRGYRRPLMTRGFHPSSPDALHAWVDRCQQLAAVPAGATVPACAALGRMLALLPRGLSGEQRVVARRLLDDAWQRVLTAALVPAGAPADHAVVPGPGTRPDAHPGERPEERRDGCTDSRVVRAIQEIDRRHADPRLRLRTLARQLAISPTHLTQLLKLSTGQTFGAHLHHRRVAHARQLLGGTALSVKEIATRVGYASTTQLDRHFKRQAGQSPSQFRADTRLVSSVPAGWQRGPCAAGAASPHNR